MGQEVERIEHLEVAGGPGQRFLVVRVKKPAGRIVLRPAEGRLTPGGSAPQPFRGLSDLEKNLARGHFVSKMPTGSHHPNAGCERRGRDPGVTR